MMQSGRKAYPRLYRAAPVNLLASEVGLQKDRLQLGAHDKSDALSAPIGRLDSEPALPLIELMCRSCGIDDAVPIGRSQVYDPKD